MFDFLSQKFSSIFANLRNQKQITESSIESTLETLKNSLIEADVPFEVAQSFISEIKQEVVGKKLIGKLKPDEQLMKIFYDKLLNFLGNGVSKDTTFNFDIPSTTLIMGLQGSGKTSTVAKIANYIKESAAKRGKKRKILVSSVDFYRPAAIDQLELLAKQVGVDFYKTETNNPIEATKEIMQYVQKNGYEILLLDTAGRMHIDETMLNELQEIDKIIKPKYKFLVLDAMTGQESLKIAQAFLQKIGYLGAIITKMDSEARAGGAFAFRYVLKRPIIFVTTGEKITDLEFFKPERVASRMLDMGDIQTLLEKAESNIEKEQQKHWASRVEKGKISLQDFADQLSMVGKLGSLSSLVKYLPGTGALKISDEAYEKGEVDLKKYKAIISSMTKKEKLIPNILNQSRKVRIAKGAGVQVEDVNALLTKFEQSQQMLKLFKKMGKF